MAKNFRFEIYTPYRLFFADEVEAIVIRIADGDIGIYADHSPFTAPVKISVLRVHDKNGSWKYAFINDGIIEVKKTKTVLLVDAAEWPEEIDIARAQKAKEDALADLENSSFKFEHNAAKQKLLRAETRLQAHDLG